MDPSKPEQPQSASPSAQALFPPTPDAAWEARLEKELRGADRAERLVWQHPDGYTLEPYYRKQSDGKATAALQDLGMPRAWSLRPAYTGPAEAEAFRLADEAARSREAQGLNAELDAATAEALAADIPEGWQVWLTSTSLPVAEGAWWMDAQCRQAESGRKATAGDWQALMDHAANADGKRQGCCLDASVWSNAGASSPDALAIALAAAAEFLAKAQEAGIAATEAARKVQVRLAAGPLFFSELAAFRAWRVVWALLGEGFAGGESQGHGPSGGKRMPWPAARIVGTASTWNLSRADRHSNLIRLTAQMMAAACGGADVLQVPRFDSAFQNGGVWESPDHTAFSERISQNLALLLRHESHLERVADPGAGSWYLEHLTDAIGQMAWARFQEIEAAGGYSAALQSGLLQGWAAQGREALHKALHDGSRPWIGVSKFPNGMETAPTFPQMEKQQGADFEPLPHWSAEAEWQNANAQ